MSNESPDPHAAARSAAAAGMVPMQGRGFGPVVPLQRAKSRYVRVIQIIAQISSASMTAALP